MKSDKKIPKGLFQVMALRPKKLIQMNNAAKTRPLRGQGATRTSPFPAPSTGSHACARTTAPPQKPGLASSPQATEPPNNPPPPKSTRSADSQGCRLAVCGVVRFQPLAFGVALPDKLFARGQPLTVLFYFGKSFIERRRC